MTLTAATLFSGIGAPEVAMPHWHWAWHAEIEKFPSAVMAARHPGSINLGDVTAHDFTERAEAIGRPDVLVFGSPCQSFSVAGKRLGLDDPRGNLALVALGIVDRLKPRWFVFENVPGLFSSFSGSEQAESEIRDRAKRGGGQVGESVDAQEDRDLAVFLSRVQDIRYSGCWGVLDAQWRGVAQRRERVFFVGNSGDWRYSAAVLLEPESLCGDSPPRRTPGQNAALPLSTRVDRGGSHREAQGNNLIANLLGAKKDGGWRGDLDHDTYVTQALDTRTGRIGTNETFVAHALRGEGFDASEDGTGRGIPLVASPITASFAKHHGSSAGKDSMPHNLVAVAGAICKDSFSGGAGGRPEGAAAGHYIAFDWRASPSRSMNPDEVTDALSGRADRAVAWDLRNGAEGDVTQTLQAAGLGTERGGNPNAVPHTMMQGGVRRLTPRECERLQSFDDDYTLIRYPTHSAITGKPLKRPRWAADGLRYKSLGNSMNRKVIRWILNRIEIFERDVRPRIEAA